jgi:hypothetical protein
LRGILNPPLRLLVEDNGASHPLRESGGGLGMVSSPAKHVPPHRGHKPATGRATIRSGFSRKILALSSATTGKIAQKAARTVEVPA